MKKEEKAEKINVDEIVDNIIDNEPEVTETFEDEPEVEAKGATFEPARDSSGNVFDPELHLVDDEGNPKLTPKGKFRKIPKSRIASQYNENDQKSRDSNTLAFLGANGFFTANIMMFEHPSFAPVKIGMAKIGVEYDEQEYLTKIIADLLVKYEIGSIEPEYALLGFIAMYYVSRLSNVEVREKMFKRIKAIVGKKEVNEKEVKPETEKEGN